MSKCCSEQAEGRGLAETYLSFGSNLGDRKSNIERGLVALERRGVRWEARSSFYETEPEEVADQPWFVNLVARGCTNLSARQLLRACKATEQEVGRTPSFRFGPRVLDIDILLYDDVILDTASLAIPHPRMHRRRFVLIPLLEIAPAIVDPRTGRSYEALAQGLDEGKKVSKSTRRES